MSESRGKAGLPDTSDRSGPQCGKVFGGSVNTTLRQDFTVAISPERSSRPSANRKRPRSISRVFHSARDEFGSRDLLSRMTASPPAVTPLRRRPPANSETCSGNPRSFWKPTPTRERGRDPSQRAQSAASRYLLIGSWSTPTGRRLLGVADMAPAKQDRAPLLPTIRTRGPCVSRSLPPCRRSGARRIRYSGTSGSRSYWPRSWGFTPCGSASITSNRSAGAICPMRSSSGPTSRRAPRAYVSGRWPTSRCGGIPSDWPKTSRYSTT